MNFQDALFRKIRETMENPKELPKLLQDILSVSADSAYRRLRGETVVSIDEAYKLSNYFKVALSDLETFRNDHVTFTRRPFINSIEQLEDFLVESLDHLELVLSDPNHQMLFLAKDIPVFYIYKFRELAAFKMFVWLRSIYDIEKINNHYYDLMSIPERLIELAQKQWEAYSRMNTLEIWNETTIVSLLNQIEYYYEAGLLSGKEQALLLCDQVNDMLRVIYRQAKHGARINGDGEPTDAGYKLYYNEVLIMNNNIMSVYKDRYIFNIPYAAVNYFTTNNEELTHEMYDYIMLQAHKSALISDVSEKERNKFFLRFRNKIDALRQRIETSNPFVI